MITIHFNDLLLAPAALAVAFMLWFLVMLWKDEHRGRYSKRKSERVIHLQDSIRTYAAAKSSRYSGRQ
jgi:hypothetical protein